MQPHRQDVLQFADFRLDIGERRLLRNDEAIPLPPKVFDLLVVLVQNHGRLMEKEDLIQKLWPGTFVEDSNLTVNISALRRALGANGKLIETVAKKGYRFTAPVREINVDDEQSPPAEQEEGRRAMAARLRWRTLVWAGAAILTMIVLGVAYFAFWRPDGGISDVRSLAVLPFSTLAADQSQEYLGLGMADAIITRLNRLKRLNLRPTSAVTRYVGQRVDLDQVVRQLHVDATVQGRIQQLDKRIRVTVQVTRARDGKQLWADAFDDYFSNIFAVQDDIAEKIAAVLSMKLSESDQRAITQRYTENTEAYQLYLQGQYLASKRLNEATATAIDYYEKAAATDPSYPLPYSALAHSYLIRAGEGFAPELRDKAKAAAHKALEMDPKSADAHIAVGEVSMRAEWDWKGAELAFREALRLNPNSAAAHAALATLHTALGRSAAAVSEMQIACRLDPTSASLRSDLAWVLHFARKYPEAIVEAKKALDLDAWSYSAHRQLAKAYLLSAMFQEAVEEAKKGLEINGGRRRRVLAELAAAEAAAGEREHALRLLNDAENGKWDDPVAPYEMAVAYARLGQRERAFAFLSSAVEQRSTRVIWMSTDPELDPLRTEARFTVLLKRLGLEKAAPL